MCYTPNLTPQSSHSQKNKRSVTRLGWGASREGRPHSGTPLQVHALSLGTDTLQTVIMVGGALVLMFLGKEEA